MTPTEVTYDICRHYLNDQVGVDEALVAKIGGFHRSRDLASLSSCSCHFDLAKHSVVDWRFLRQVEAFFKKNSIFARPEVCRATATAGFHTAEAKCSETNLRLQPFVRRPDLIPAPFNEQVGKMARYISNVLGNFQSFLDELPRLVKVTPGATSHAARRNSLPQLKMRMSLYATHRATTFLKALYHFYGFKSPRVKATPSNRVELVPKNWKTDRTIACEPEGNLPLQLAFDTYAKRRLCRFGIDLRDQSANKKRAHHASIHDDYVTVDFQMASDTIAYNVVALVFPVDWLRYLDRVRSPMYRGVMGEGVYSKFSSMGNGSTFCIETLLFAAACHAVGSRDFLVYGDDVIIGKEFYEAYLALTGYLGFTINVDKSFASGPFRESCGGDYFNGCDVTPIYIRGFDERKASLCHLVNSIGAIAYDGGHLQRFLARLTISRKLPLVPFNESTLSGVWIDERSARAKGILRTKCSHHSFRAYVANTKTRKFVDSRGYYLWFLRKNAQAFFAGPWDICRQESKVDASNTETSSVAVFDHSYVRKRVSWFGTPALGEPDGLQSLAGLIESLGHLAPGHL